MFDEIVAFARCIMSLFTIKKQGESFRTLLLSFYHFAQKFQHFIFCEFFQKNKIMLTNFSAKNKNDTIIEKIAFFGKSQALFKIQHLFLLNFHFPIYFSTFFVKIKEKIGNGYLEILQRKWELGNKDTH